MRIRIFGLVFLLIIVCLTITGCQKPIDPNLTEKSIPQHDQTAASDIGKPAGVQEVGLPLDIKTIENHFAGEEGTMVIKAANSNQSIVFHEQLAHTAFSPCSTFKIPNALIGLEQGVVTDSNTLLKWDGTVYRVKDWNQDHTLESAIKYSAVWYFRELAKAVGMETMQQYVAAFDYGNADTSGGIEYFWLDSTLKITAYEQVEFMEKFYQGDLPVRQENINLVKKMLVLDSFGSGKLSGKTGTGSMGGWFVGYYETPQDVYLFAAFMKEKQGSEVKQIVIEILSQGEFTPD